MSESRVIHGDAREVLRDIDLEGAVALCDERWIPDAEMALRIGSSQGQLDFGDHAEPDQIAIHGEET